MKHQTSKTKRQRNKQISAAAGRLAPTPKGRSGLRRVLDLVIGVSLVFVVWLLGFLPDNDEN